MGEKEEEVEEVLVVGMVEVVVVELVARGRGLGLLAEAERRSSATQTVVERLSSPWRRAGLLLLLSNEHDLGKIGYRGY